MGHSVYMFICVFPVTGYALILQISYGDYYTVRLNRSHLSIFNEARILIIFNQGTRFWEKFILGKK